MTDKAHTCPACGRYWACGLPLCPRGLLALCPKCQASETRGGVADHPEKTP